jgi:SprB repeat/Secretion system C-terminal sorting domain
MRKLINNCLLFAFALLAGSISLQAQEIDTAIVSCAFNVEYIQYNPACPGEGNGSLELIVTNNDGTVNYDWIDVDPNENPNTESVDALHAGTYNVIISDNSGCVDTVEFILVDPEPVDFDLVAEDVTCIGDQNGVITVETAIDGLIDSYTIDNSGIDQANPVFEGLGAGIHTIYVTDLNGCVFEKTVEVAAPEEPEIEFETLDVTCPGGNNASFIVIIETVSMTEDYEFSLNGEDFQADSTFTELEAGEYEVFIQNEAGCIFIDTVEITEPEEPTLDYNKNNVTCPDGEDGSFIVIIETVSLTEDYEYSLNGGEFQADSTFTNLTAGIYTVEVRNPDSCVFSITVEITEPTEPEPGLIIENESCEGSNDGSLTVNLPDSLGVFEYSLDSINYQDSNVFENLGAGSYELFLSNEIGCVSIIDFEITAPDAPEFTIETIDVSCDGGDDGEIEINVSSGTSPIEYALDEGEFQTSNIFTNLTAGEYTVTVLDGNGCSFTEEVTINEPDPIDALVSGGNETCSYENGWASVAVEGGTSPYDYEWSNGAKDPAITNLSESTYQITITDLSGCLYVEEIIIQNEAAPVVGAEINDVSCNGEEDGWISLEIESESYPLKYYWSNGDDRSQIANLKAANYSVTVIDANNCYTSEIFTVIEPEKLTLNADFGFEKSKGNINLVVEGGTPTFDYFWSNGSTEEDLIAVNYGDYSVTVTDAKGCEETASFRVFDLSQPLDENINVYPVPTFEYINIELVLPDIQNVQLFLIDELGREMLRTEEKELENEVITLNLGHLPGAIYLLRIHVGENIVIKRIIKQSN